MNIIICIVIYIKIVFYIFSSWNNCLYLFVNSTEWEIQNKIRLYLDSQIKKVMEDIFLLKYIFLEIRKDTESLFDYS
jgi:hypothetical protein